MDEKEQEFLSWEQVLFDLKVIDFFCFYLFLVSFLKLHPWKVDVTTTVDIQLFDNKKG